MNADTYTHQYIHTEVTEGGQLRKIVGAIPNTTRDQYLKEVLAEIKGNDISTASGYAVHVKATSIVTQRGRRAVPVMYVY